VTECQNGFGLHFNTVQTIMTHVLTNLTRIALQPYRPAIVFLTILAVIKLIITGNSWSPPLTINCMRYIRCAQKHCNFQPRNNYCQFILYLRATIY